MPTTIAVSMIFMTVKIGQEKRAHEDLILGDAPLLQQETEDDAKYKIKIQQIE